MTNFDIKRPGMTFGFTSNTSEGRIMSRFVIFLFAFLLVGAVCADETQTGKEDPSPNLVEDLKNKVIDLINGAIKQINDKIEEVQETTSEYAKKLKEEALNVAKTVYKKILAVEEQVKSQIQKLVDEAINVNVTECAQMAESVDKAGVQALHEVSQCVTDVIEDADSYIENMINSSNKVLKNLTDIKDEAELCVKDVHDVKSAAKAFYCVNVAAAKGTWAATKKVPALLMDIGKLTYKITILMPKLAVCSSVNGVKKVNESSTEIVNNVKECIRARKEQAESKNSE